MLRSGYEANNDNIALEQLKIDVLQLRFFTSWVHLKRPVNVLL